MASCTRCTCRTGTARVLLCPPLAECTHSLHCPLIQTGQNTDKGLTPNPRIEIQIPDPAKIRTRAAGLEARDRHVKSPLWIKVILQFINIEYFIYRCSYK